MTDDEIKAIRTIYDRGYTVTAANDIPKLLDEIERLREALTDIARGDYSDPMCMKTPEQRARDALASSSPSLASVAPAMLAVVEGLVDWWRRDGISGNRTLDDLASQARNILRDLKGPEK